MEKLTSDPKLKTYLLICLVSLCPFILIAVIRNFDILQLIELRTLDARLRLMRVPDVSSDLILITIDDKSQSNEGIGQLPWPPYIYSSLLESLQTTKPAATGLIARFNRDWEGSEIPGDNLFVIQLYTAEDNYPTRIPHIKDWIDLPQMLTNADTVSFSVFPESQSDGIYRSGQLVVFNTQENSLKFSLEILMLCQLHGIPPETIKLKDSIWKGKFLAMKLESGKDIRIPIDAAGRTFPRLIRNFKRFPSMSFIDVLLSSEKTKGESFQHKISLIGVTTPDVPKAQTAFGKMSALELRANLMNSLLNQNLIWKPSHQAEIFYLAIFAIISSIGSILVFHNRRNYRTQLVLTSGLFILHLLFSITIFILAAIWVQIAIASLAIIISGVSSCLFLGHTRLRETLHELQKTQEQLIKSEKEAAFGVIAARVRHELRNVLNLIQSPAEMIRNNFLKGDPLNLRRNTQEIVSEMDAIIGRVTKLDEMIENELSFFHNTHLELRLQEIGPIIRSAIQETEPIIQENKTDVRVDLPPTVPLIRMNSEKMRMVFVNLIRNACQAIRDDGKIAIKVRFQNKIVITLEDNGCGIPHGNLDRVFEPFFTTKPHGLGLGLMNARNIVEEHNGTIQVNSEMGSGTTFVIELPIGET